MHRDFLIIMTSLNFNKCIEYGKEMIGYELSYDINHITMQREITEIIVREKENGFFHVRLLT